MTWALSPGPIAAMLQTQLRAVAGSEAVADTCTDTMCVAKNGDANGSPLVSRFSRDLIAPDTWSPCSEMVLCNRYTRGLSRLGFHLPPEPRLLWASPIPRYPGRMYDQPREASTGRIPHHHTGSDGQRRGETDRFPEGGLRRPGKGTVHRSDREDRPRG